MCNDMILTATNNVNINNANNNTIQDFGEKIGGARKDYAAERMEFVQRLHGCTPEMLKSTTLSKVVTLAQLQKVAANLPQVSACACLAMWRTIGTKPSRSYRLSQWIEATRNVLDKIAAIIDGDTNCDAAAQLPEYDVLMASGYPLKPFSFGKYRVTRLVSSWYYYGDDRGKYAVVSGDYYRYKDMDPAAVAAWINEHVAADNDERKAGATFVLCKQDGVYFAAPKGKTRIHVREWSSREDAIIGMKNIADLRDRWEKIRTTPSLRRTTNRDRVGEDYRHGLSVTPEQFAAAFPFRGVEFGNWLTQGDRIIRLNETFDALHDLCVLCGLNADAVTLKSWLAMAFGSRGIPGANAHFEALHRVINLTKEHGAGSLAHEWFHALDNFTARRFDGRADQFATDDYSVLPEGELYEASRALYRGLKNSPFAKRSDELDYIKGKAYFAKTIEMAARAFEVYVIMLAKSKGMVVDFLANVSDYSAWQEAGMAHLYPYPTEDEMGVLAPLYERFLSAAAGASELSASAAELFAAGRKAVEAQKASEDERKAQERADKQALTDKRKAEAEAEVAAIADKVLAETPATWYKVFHSAGVRAYAVGGGIGFVFMVMDGKVGYLYTSENSRLKKDFRTAHQVRVEFKKGVDVEQALRKAADYGFCICNQEFYNMYRFPGAWRYASYAEFAAKFADQLAEARKASEPQKSPVTAQKVVDGTTTRNTDNDATAATSEPSAATSEQQGKSQSPDLNPQSEDAPAAGLSLVSISGGVAVVGDSRTTYKNRKLIKAHGARWNKDAKQWQATDAAAVESLRRWFGMDAQEQQPVYSEPEKSELPAWLKVGNIVRRGSYVCKITVIDVANNEVGYSAFKAAPMQDYRCDLRQFIHEVEISRPLNVPAWLHEGAKVVQRSDGAVRTVAHLWPSVMDASYCVETVEEPGEWYVPDKYREPTDADLNPSPTLAEIYEQEQQGIKAAAAG